MKFYFPTSKEIRKKQAKNDEINGQNFLVLFPILRAIRKKKDKSEETNGFSIMTLQIP